MRHQNHRHRLGRPIGTRTALLRSLCHALITEERIVTTLPKAKALRREAEKLITLGKKGDLAARRRALQILPEKDAINKLFNQVAPQFAERNGGYTRILKLTPRNGDAAPMAMMELVGYTDKMLAAVEEKAAEAEKPKKGLRQRVAEKVNSGKQAAAKKEAKSKSEKTEEVEAPAE